MTDCNHKDSQLRQAANLADPENIADNLTQAGQPKQPLQKPEHLSKSEQTPFIDQSVTTDD